MSNSLPLKNRLALAAGVLARQDGKRGLRKAMAIFGALWCAAEAERRRSAGLAPLPCLVDGLHDDVERYRHAHAEP